MTNKSFTVHEITETMLTYMNFDPQKLQITTNDSELC